VKVLTLTAAFVLVLAIQAEPGDPLGIRLLPGFISPAPAQLRVLTTVETHADNRELEVVAESPSFYRSSSVSLNGEQAPRLSEFVFKNLPSGQYEVTATLKGSQGRRRAVQSRFFHVSDEGGR
jgi:hypothetical protein